MEDLLDTRTANPTIHQSTATMQTTGKNYCHSDEVAGKRNSRLRQYCRLFALIMASSLFYGCATPQPLAPYVLGSSGGRVVHGSGPGVQISAEVVTNPQTLKDYFGVSSPSLGVLTIFIKAENTGGADSVLLEKTEMQLTADSGTQGENGDPLKKRGDILNSGQFAKQTATDAVVVGLLAGPAFAPFALLGAMDAAHKAKADTDYNFMKWEFRTATLEPGQAANGFVYFGGNTAALPPDNHLLVTVHDLSKQTTNIVNIPFNQ